jgi:hypothetical protein
MRNRTRDLTAFIIVPQRTTLKRAPLNFTYVRQNIINARRLDMIYRNKGLPSRS